MKLPAGYGKALFDQVRLAGMVLRLRKENEMDATVEIGVVDECDAEADAHSAGHSLGTSRRATSVTGLLINHGCSEPMIPR